MHRLPTTAPRGSTRFSLIGFGAAAVAALALSLGAYLAISYQREVAGAQQTAEKLARALEVHSRAVMTAVDGVLQSSIRELGHATAFGHSDPAALHSVLKASVEGQRTIGSLWLLDIDGHVIATSVSPTVPRLDYGTRRGFQFHREGRTVEPIFGVPTANPLTGKMGLTVSRRLIADNGRFAGVLAAGIPIETFSEFLESLQVGGKGSAALIRDDGIFLAREPAEGMIGASLSQSVLFREQLPKSPTGTYHVTTVLDQIDRIISYRAVSPLPLVVTVGIAVDDALADWYRDVWTYVAIWLVCAGLIAAFTAVIVRQASRREAAENIAREAEGRFQRLVANVPGCVFQRVLKTDGSIAYNFISAHSEKLFGYTPERILGDSSLLVNAIHPDHRAAFYAELRRSAETLSPFSFEVLSVRHDGEQRWVHTISIPERRPSGEIVWDGAMLDITDRKTAELALREGERRFQRLVANVPGTVYQRILTPGGVVRFNYLSPQVETMYGITADAIMRDPQIFMDAVHEEDRSAYMARVRESAATLAPLIWEMRVRHMNGNIRWIHTLSTPYRSEDGTVVWDGLAIDITDRKRAEIALTQSEADASRTRALLLDAIESLNDGFVLYDADDRLVLVNRVARDWSPELTATAVPGARFEDIVRAAAATGKVRGNANSMEGLIQERLAMHRKSFGTVLERQVGEHWYHVREHPTSEGGVVILRTDVTELKQTNLRLAHAMTLAQEANRAKSDFLAMMSHELRTPLNVVIGFAEILRTHGDHISTEKIVDYAGDVHEAATHLLNLINDVLDLSKAEAGKMELQRSAVDVADVIRRSLRMVQERAVRRRITLTDQIADGLPIIWADERKLMQILINLLSNAVKFTPDGGQITIAARRADAESLIIEVVDTGIGIAPEHIDIALTAFGQIDSNLTRQQPGTGLGLPLAKRLTELHGATFDLRSQVGLGTTVSLRFPVVRAWATARI